MAVLPGLLWLYAFWRMDHYEPEPLGLLLWTFFLGALAFGLAVPLEQAAGRALLGPGSPLDPAALPLRERALLLFLVVAPAEELVKFAAAWVSVGRHPEYDEPVDGVIYMVAAALGFASAENLYYLPGLDGLGMLSRGVFSCFLHAACSGLVGYWWSEIRFHGRTRLVLPGSLLAASIAHGLFNAVAFGTSGQGFLVLALFLAALDAALMARITQALHRSPHKPDEEVPPPLAAPEEAP